MNDRIFENLLFNKIRFLIILKINEIFKKIRKFLFYSVFKEKMLTNEIEDGREAP